MDNKGVTHSSASSQQAFNQENDESESRRGSFLGSAVASADPNSELNQEISSSADNVGLEDKSVEVITLDGSTATCSDYKSNDDLWRQKHYENNLNAIVKGIDAVQESADLPEPGNIVENKTRELINSMLANVSNSQVGDKKPKATHRGRYKKVILSLRKLHKILAGSLAQGSVFFDHCTKLVNRIGYGLFFEPRDNRFYSDLVQSIKENAGQEELVPESLNGKAIADQLQATFEAIRSQKESVSNARGVKKALAKARNIAAGEVGLNYDPYLQGNQPYPLMRFRVDGRQVTNIRIGTPTKQKIGNSAVVIPEFQVFLQSLAEGKRHLYINRQKRKGVEGSRSNALENFQNSSSLKEKLTVVTLPADGDLYQQKGAFARDIGIEQLKDQLVHAMDNNKSGFFFPEKMKSEREGDFREFLTRAVDDMANELNINRNEAMSSALRRACIFHFLNKTLPLAMLRREKADSYNNSCKDNIDRGTVGTTYMFISQQILANIADVETITAFMRELEGVLFAPAITVKKREVVKHRFDDLINALHTLDYWNAQLTASSTALPPLTIKG